MGAAEREAVACGWRAFVEGATRPSLAGLLGTLGVCAGTILAAAALITPRNLARHEIPFYYLQGQDPNLRATLAALRARDSQAQPETVGIFGASAQLFAVEVSERCTEVFTEVLGRETPVQVLCAPGISLPELLAQVEATQSACGGAIVVGISPMLLAQPAELDPRLRRLGLLPPRWATGVYLFDQWVFLAPRLDYALMRWLRFNAPLVRRRRPRKPPNPWPGTMAMSEEEIVRELPSRAQRVEHGIATLRLDRQRFVPLMQALARLQGDGRAVVLLESVLNPRLRDLVDPAAWAEYQAMLGELAARSGAHYWDLAEAAQLAGADFQDIGHIGNADARLRYTRELAERLAPLLASGAAPIGPDGGADR